MTITAKRKKIIAFLRSLDVDAPATWAKKILPPESIAACRVDGKLTPLTHSDKNEIALLVKQVKSHPERQYLELPENHTTDFGKAKKVVEKLGAKYDATVKEWWIKKHANNTAKFAAWLP